MHAFATAVGSPGPSLPGGAVTRAARRASVVHVLGAREIATFGALLVFWALCNPFFGIDSSNLIYAGRALADLDPGGVGRDAMFVHDGQSGFTIFTLLFKTLAKSIGLSRASILIAAAAVASAFLGAVILASALAEGRARLLIVAFAASLPAQYGGYKLFAYAEVAATPRPFAEALVLCGIAALLHRRHLTAIALMGLATLLHPIMAASGVALLAAWLVLEDRRWLVPITLAPVAVALLALAGVAPFDRLATIIDPAWTDILKDRNPQLFPSLWLDGWMGRLTVRVATLLIAARVAPPRVRRLFLLVVPIGLAGLAVAYLIGERAGSLIVLQAQTWRLMWIVFALATAAAAIATIELWRQGGTARVALGFMALAWAFADCDGPACLFAIVALGTVYAIDPQRYAHAARWLDLLFAALLAWALYGLARTELAILSTPGTSGALAAEMRRANANGLDYTPLAFVAAAVAIAEWPRLGTRGICALASTGALLLSLTWDQRSTANVYFDSGRGAPDLEQRLAARQGEVYWIDGGRQTWWWLHRPQWLAPIQGAGVVFSRDLAVTYKERAARAIEAGVADRGLMAPLLPSLDVNPRPITAASLATFCAAVDAPAWIIAPLDGPRVLADDIARTVWTAPITELQPLNRGRRLAARLPLRRHALRRRACVHGSEDVGVPRRLAGSAVIGRADIDIVDLPLWRPFAQDADEIGQRLARPAQHRLDRAILAIAHPAFDLQSARRRHGEVPVIDALDAARDANRKRAHAIAHSAACGLVPAKTTPCASGPSNASTASNTAIVPTTSARPNA